MEISRWYPPTTTTFTERPPIQKVKAVYDQREYLLLDPQQLRLTEQTYKRFVPGRGIHARRAKGKINEQLKDQTRRTIRQQPVADNNAFTLVIDKQEDLGVPPLSSRPAPGGEPQDGRQMGL